ncbi:MAG: MFS transporter [Pseudomonadales bacterium]
MFITLRSVKSLLLAIAILLVGHGLQLTLLPLHANSLGWSASAIGFTASAYFVGFVLGCLTIPKMVSRVGHIRVFAVLSAVTAAVLLLMGIFEYFWVWLAARCLTGWAIAGLYMIIESWLNERASTTQRGTIISVYAVITMLAIFTGQFLLGLPLEGDDSLFMLAAVLLLLGLVPVGLTRASTPQPIPVIKFNLRRLYRSTHVAVVGAFVGGLVTGGFWALGPLFANLKGLETSQVGLFMAAGILGGAVFQLPFGKLSDSFDRRKIMVLICALSVVTCSLVVIASEVSVGMMYGLMFIFGATCFPIYSLCLAHANDHSKLPLIEIASGILMLHGAGAVMAPVVIGPLMAMNVYALFYVFGAAYAMLGLWIAIRIRNHAVEVDESHPFVDLPKTTQSIVDLAPEDGAHDSDDDDAGSQRLPAGEDNKVVPLVSAA